MIDKIRSVCRQVLESGVVGDPIELSHHGRCTPLAVDVDDDMAVVVVATAGQGVRSSVWTYEFQHVDSAWMPRGGGGGGTNDPHIPERPASVAGWYRLTSWGSSGTGPNRAGIRAPRVHHAVFQAAPEVATVELRGLRRDVAEHGYVCVVWREGSAPLIAFLDADARQLNTVRCPEPPPPSIDGPRGGPRRRIGRSSGDGGWFNYSPEPET